MWVLFPKLLQAVIVGGDFEDPLKPKRTGHYDKICPSETVEAKEAIRQNFQKSKGKLKTCVFLSNLALLFT